MATEDINNNKRSDNDDENENQVDPLKVIDTLFNDYDYDPKDTPSSITTTDHIYPELILQESEHGNKYYSCFQSYNRQFINDPTTTTTTTNNINHHSEIVRWTGSTIELTASIILDNWLNQSSGNGTKSNNNSGSNSTTTTSKRHISRPNALFVWASTDEYIEERKKELRRLQKLKDNGQDQTQDKSQQIQNGTNNRPTDDSKNKNNSSTGKSKQDIVKQNLKQKLDIEFSNVAINNKLNRIIEIESNKFIHARIQRIKAHYSEQMEKQINERKRKDQELYLKKLKLKEEEYEQESSLRSKNSTNSGGGTFLGNLFGFNSATVGGTSVNTLESTYNNRSSTESSPKPKRFPLFSVAGLFGGSSKKNSSKTVLFEPNEINEDGKDETNLSTPTIENDQSVDPENDTRPNIVIDQDSESKPLPPKPKPCENRSTPDLNQDDTNNQHPTQPQTTATTTTTANNFFSIDELEQHIKKSAEPSPSKSNKFNDFLAKGQPTENGTTSTNDNNDYDEDDEEFDDFTSAQPIHDNNNDITIFQDPPKLNRNFFSIDKAKGNSVSKSGHNQINNDLLEIFSPTNIISTYE
ncbi:hypothetical protein FOB64_003614 [Candida albicans]|uniref:Uncharacterized protein n=1 Tax=Candida albicans TaxID=5476 RepID=A0A8H6BYE3_CANAX|nr:hypothetical protein FOB64_003614 [Candida albicans]